MTRPIWLFPAALCALAPVLLTADDFPQRAIISRQVQAKFYLPDADRGYYRGTRFDWSGVMPSLEYKGHQYFGQWFERYDPKLHDAIMGPVEEFRTNDAGLGYDEAKAGGTFIRIGVGVVRKPDDKPYEMFHTYDIVNTGQWSVRNGTDWIEFTQRLQDASGYGYVYTKRVSLDSGKPQMVIEHSLQNIGSKTINTTQYNHNFFVIDHQTTGPDVVVEFPFTPQPDRDLKGLAQVSGKDLKYTSTLEKGQSLLAEMKGYGETKTDYDFRIENRRSGAGVRIRGDHPLAKVVFWSIRTVACPEPYIQIEVKPGKREKWKYTYDFYLLPSASGGNPAE
ncbi:MAG: hypothetical protein JO022_13925 [Acidobacteriaceae bacterium]|nr:hypothetical protein [Acidobacteriaceae bacterium]